MEVGGDISAQDCRSILIPAMASQPQHVFTAAELADLLRPLLSSDHRRPDRMVFDALRKPVRLGWVVRVGRGQYRLGTVPPSTLCRHRRWRRALDAGLNRLQRSAYSNWRPIN